MASQEAELAKIAIAIEDLRETINTTNEHLKRIAATLESKQLRTDFD